MANEIARRLRRNRTSAESKLWGRLRQLKWVGLRFRQQAPIDRFVVDFVCFGKRLIVEVDGATHSTQDERQRDKDREDFLLTQGFRVVRFSNEDVLQNLDGVMDTIVHALNMPPPPHPLPARGRG